MSVLDAPELAPYLDEPGQMPSGAPGKNGVLAMSFARRGDRSVLAHLYRKAPLLVQQALYWDEHLPGLACVYIITTSGCLLQGDRLHVSITMDADTMAHVTTQSATKVHQMDANFAAQSQQLTLAENSYLELLPGPTIPHRHSRYITRTRAAVADSATLLSAEVLQPGRKHHGAGELFEYDLYSSALTVARPDGTPLFTEKLVAEPWRHPVHKAGVMGEFDVLASVTLVTPRRHAEKILEQVVGDAEPAAQCLTGASRLPHDAGLIYKVLGMETEPVQAKVRAFWGLVRNEVAGAPVPAARPWGPSPVSPRNRGLRCASDRAGRSGARCEGVGEQRLVGRIRRQHHYPFNARRRDERRGTCIALSHARRSRPWRRSRAALEGVVRKSDSWVGLDIEVSVVGADRHDEMVQEALQPGEPEWVGPWIAEPDRRVPGELITAIGHREADAG
jgi:urease accessory protein